MDWPVALLALLHVLVPIYWLGGDLGAFYSARFLIDARRPVNERMMALTILNNIDMAPRTTLILAFPTGLSLAVAKGWLAVPPLWLGAMWVGFAAWLALAWAVHLRHGAGYKRVDIAVRYGVLAALAGAGLAGVTGLVALPLFIALKLLLLAACIAAGLLVRVQLVPLFPAIIAMKTAGATAETDTIIRRVLARTTPTVQAIWVLVLAACFLGLATPV